MGAEQLLESVGKDISASYSEGTKPDVEAILDSHELMGDERGVVGQYASDISGVCRRNEVVLRDVEPAGSFRNGATFIATGISGQVFGGLCAYVVAYLSNASPEGIGHAVTAGSLIGASVAYTLEMLFHPAQKFVSRIAYRLGQGSSKKRAVLQLAHLDNAA